VPSLGQMTQHNSDFPAMARMTESIICITFVRFSLLLPKFSKNHKIGFVNRGSAEPIADFGSTLKIPPSVVDDRDIIPSPLPFPAKGRVKSLGKCNKCGHAFVFTVEITASSLDNSRIPRNDPAARFSIHPLQAGSLER